MQTLRMTPGHLDVARLLGRQREVHKLGEVHLILGWL